MNQSESLADRMDGRRMAQRGVALLVLLVLQGCQPLSRASGPDTSPPGTIEGEVARLVNDYRQRLGCPRLVWDWTLADVARDHSADMNARAYFGHRDPDGNDLSDRLQSAGVNYSLAAENIAQGFRYEEAARAVFEGWLKSSGHRSIIENCTFATHGVGFVDFVWTHVFVR